MQIKAVKPADIALGLTESEGYQVTLKHKKKENKYIDLEVVILADQRAM